MSRRIKPLIFSVSTLIIAACSGGGSPSSPNTKDSIQPQPSNGRVTVLVTDAPGPDWDQAIATITSIELLGDRRAVIFEGESTVDLLSLPDFYEVFAVADDIAPDVFEKVRVRVKTLELVENDDEGNELQRVQAQLVGGGKIDLNPRQDIVIGPGDSLFIEIDFDMNKAFKTTTTRNGRVIVRPVVMVNVTAEPPVARLTRLRGTIEEIDAENLKLELCQSELVGAMSNEEDAEGESGHDECIDVTVDEQTGLFGGDGLPIGFGDLGAGDLATAIGYLRRELTDGPDNDIDLHAVTVELGEDFLRVAGIAGGAVMGDVFDLGVDPGQGLGTDDAILSTRVFAKTRIFHRNGDELDRSAILSGVGVMADGVLVPDEALPDTLRTALLILNPELDLAEEVLSGQIVSIHFDAGTLQLMVGESEVCVNALEADIFLVSNAGGFSSQMVGLGDLEPPRAADVFGDGEDDAGCFMASDILASAISANTLPVADAGDDRNVDTGLGVMLDGSASSDADGDPLSYAWAFTSVPEGSAAELLDADTVLPTFTTDVDGEYVAELIVNDGREDSAPDDVVITAATP